MTPPSELLQVLRATGFMIGDIPAPGLMLDSPVLHDRIDLRPDAIWCDRSQLKMVFKCVPDEPPRTQIASWHRDVWNLGLTPLLWIVSPQRIRLYNAYERPKSTEDAGAHLLWQARMVDEELSRLDEYAGRLAMTSGRFWSNEDRIERGGRVDAQLLCDLQEVENQLCSAGLPREVAQGLLGRSIFVRYLADREIVGSDTLNELGFHDLRMALREHGQAYRLFDWVRSTFNGDLFPVTVAERNAVTAAMRVAVSVGDARDGSRCCGQAVYLPSLFRERRFRGAVRVEGRPGKIVERNGPSGGGKVLGRASPCSSGSRKPGRNFRVGRSARSSGRGASRGPTPA